MISGKLPVFFINKEECCGCSACCAICPNEAITMLADEEGFLYPHVDAEKCVRCYRCLKVCPFKMTPDDASAPAL